MTHSIGALHFGLPPILLEYIALSHRIFHFPTKPANNYLFGKFCTEDVLRTQNNSFLLQIMLHMRSVARRTSQVQRFDEL